ncbi:F-box domain-containing protein [Mycena venus]|uniref:F-box domain-containing protein n=1 Tax=Mycena venus TaxID=2733690 RepID=A0A8H6TYN7_9AGAR|nr:F-box domain-containing protein [Mycena venus]
MDASNSSSAAQPGILKLPDEILLKIFGHLDPGDPGIFAISTANKRLHYIALPIYLSGYGVDASASGCEEITLRHMQLVVLDALQTARFIRSVKRMSCTFSRNSVLYHIRNLTSFLSVLERVDEVILDFKDLDFRLRESDGSPVPALETFTSTVTALADVFLAKQGKVLTIEGGSFPPESPQAQKPAEPEHLGSRVTVKRLFSDVGHKIGGAFGRRADSAPPKSAPALAGRDKRAPSGLTAFNLNSTLLLLPPCCTWTLAVLSASSHLTSLSIARIDIPEGSWNDIFHSLDQFLARHPLIRTLHLGPDLPPLEKGHATSTTKDWLPNLIDVSASPTYVRFILADKRAPAVRNVRLLWKLASTAIFQPEEINHTLAPCQARLEHIHLTLVIPLFFSVDLSLAFPQENTKEPRPDSLRGVRAFELRSTDVGRPMLEIVL